MVLFLLHSCLPDQTEPFITLFVKVPGTVMYKLERSPNTFCCLTQFDIFKPIGTLFTFKCRMPESGQNGSRTLLQSFCSQPWPSNPNAALSRMMLFILVLFPFLVFIVVDPWHFGMDPDPRIRSTDIRIGIRILLFSSVTFKMPTKNNFLFCLLLFEANIYIILQR